MILHEYAQVVDLLQDEGDICSFLRGATYAELTTMARILNIFNFADGVSDMEYKKLQDALGEESEHE